MCDVFSFTERKEARREKAKLKAQTSAHLEKKLRLHVVSRSPVYPNCFIQRFPVPDEKVPWEVSLENIEIVLTKGTCLYFGYTIERLY